MKSKPQVFREADIDHVISRLKAMASNYPSFDDFLVNVIKQLDKKKKGFITYDDLILGMHDLGIEVTNQEAYTLMRYFDVHKDWKLSMRDLFMGLGGKIN